MVVGRVISSTSTLSQVKVERACTAAAMDTASSGESSNWKATPGLVFKVSLGDWL